MEIGVEVEEETVGADASAVTRTAELAHVTADRVSGHLFERAYIGEENLDAAEQFPEATEKAFAKLAAMPRMGRRWRSEDSRLDAMRVWPIPGWKYLVFYRPVEHGIDVVRVLHGAQDVAALVAKENRR